MSIAAWALARKEKSLFKNKAKVTEFCDRRSDSQRSSPIVYICSREAMSSSQNPAFANNGSPTEVKVICVLLDAHLQNDLQKLSKH